MARRGVDLNKLGREIELKIRAERSVKWKTRAFAQEVADYWADVAWTEVGLDVPSRTGPGHPYETGEYADSIHVEQMRDVKGRFLAGFRVEADSPNANFIEFGTGPDKPGSKSPWGMDTPTPEYAPAAKTAHHYRGTSP